MRSLRDLINGKKLIGWGTGEYLLKYGKKILDNIEYFVDSNENKWEKTILGKEIKSPEKLLLEDGKECVIVIFSTYYEEIENLLLDKHRDFSWMDGYVLHMMSDEKLFWQEEVVESIRKISADTNVYVSIASFPCSYGLDSGTLKFVHTQNKALTENGKEVIHMSPMQMHFMDSSKQIFVMRNNKPFGVVGIDLIRKAIEKDNICVKAVIMHSNVQRVKCVMELLELLNPEKTVCYIHDFSSLCSNNYFLYLPDKKDICPTAKNLKYECEGCRYNTAQRKNVYNTYKNMFAKENVMIVAPSKRAAAIISGAFGVDKAKVIAHLVYGVLKEERAVIHDKLRIGFIGAANVEKGWGEFKSLTDAFGDKYEFICLGRYAGVSIDKVKFVDVSATHQGGALDMVQAIEQEDIDIAFLGSVWPETYSYTLFEVLQTGRWILTVQNSGNISDEVIRLNAGYVAKDLQDMIDLLEDEEALRKAVHKVTRITDVHDNLELLDQI